MDSTLEINAIHLRNSKPRQLDRQRKVFLDTYAKKRAAHAGVPDNFKCKQQLFKPSANSGFIENKKNIHVQSKDISAMNKDIVDDFYVNSTLKKDVLPNKRDIYDSTAQPNNSKLANKKLDYLQTISRQKDVFKQSAVMTNFSSDLNRSNASNQKKQMISANLDALYAGSLTEQIARNKQSASASHIRTIVAGAAICGVIAISVFMFLGIGRSDSSPVVAQPVNNSVIEVEAPPAQAPPQGAPVATPSASGRTVLPTDPVRVVISKIGVNAPVQGVAQTSDGAMDVPRSYGLVGWYEKGVTVGQAGPAVLVGHYAGGGGAVFDNLGGLENGDLITVTNGKGENFTYRVTKMAEYNKNHVPMAEIFKKSDHSRLEIITCAGKWQADTYNNRLVVTAELVQ